MNKNELRKFIAQRKKNCSQQQFKDWSYCILEKLESHPAFAQSKTILLYYSLPDEVHTHEFIERWKDKKQIILPVVIGPTELELRKYTGIQDLITGAYGIKEPIGRTYKKWQEIELAIIPGVAFDRKGNRLGRGKGYYDRLLPQINALKIGICYQFQLIDNIPTNQYDYPMDEIITEES